MRGWIRRPALFLHVAAPLVHFSPIGVDRFPDRWEEGEYRGAMRLFGLLPIGWQAIVIEFPTSADTDLVLRDRGYGPLLREWDHRIAVSPHGSGTRYVDRLTLDAGWLTPIAAFGVKQFFRHRQRRLVALDQAAFAPLKG